VSIFHFSWDRGRDRSGTGPRKAEKGRGLSGTCRYETGNGFGRSGTCLGNPGNVRTLAGNVASLPGGVRPPGMKAPSPGILVRGPTDGTPWPSFLGRRPRGNGRGPRINGRHPAVDLGSPAGHSLPAHLDAPSSHSLRSVSFPAMPSRRSPRCCTSLTPRSATLLRKAVRKLVRPSATSTTSCSPRDRRRPGRFQLPRDRARSSSRGS
jgi:hypothetical protein